jgi:hypothetical protein
MTDVDGGPSADRYSGARDRQQPRRPVAETERQ